MQKIFWPMSLIWCVVSAATHADTINLSSISVQGQSTEVQATPERWLMDEELFMRLQGTLGATLAKEPGIHNESYGAGAGRPIIRGQGAPRVNVLSDGVNVIDASSLSPDHANAVEPLLARGVEVIRGPATLLYGSGLNGTVNVLHQRVPTAMPANGHEGSVAFQGSSVDNGYQGAFDLTGQVSEHWVFHGAVALGETADYKAPKQSTRHVPDTATEKVVGTLGASWIGERGYLGFAVTDHSNRYGLPGHSHVQVPIMLTLSLLAALAIDSLKLHGTAFFRISIFMPYAVPAVVAALMWGFMYGNRFGLVGSLSDFLGVSIPDPLGANVILVSIGNIVTWEFVGYNMLIFYSSLKTIPHSLYEAAAIDGASEWRIIAAIKIPALRGALGIATIFSIIGSFQLFNEPSILQSLAPNAITTYYTPNYYAYNLSFAGQQYNYSATVAIVMGLITMAVAYFVQLRGNREN